MYPSYMDACTALADGVPHQFEVAVTAAEDAVTNVYRPRAVAALPGAGEGPAPTPRSVELVMDAEATPAWIKTTVE